MKKIIICFTGEPRALKKVYIQETNYSKKIRILNLK